MLVVAISSALLLTAVVFQLGFSLLVILHGEDWWDSTSLLSSERHSVWAQKCQPAAALLMRVLAGREDPRAPSTVPPGQRERSRGGLFPLQKHQVYPDADVVQGKWARWFVRAALMSSAAREGSSPLLLGSTARSSVQPQAWRGRCWRAHRGHVLSTPVYKCLFMYLSVSQPLH